MGMNLFKSVATAAQVGFLFGTGVGMQLGQFQLSDLMFPREVRLPFQDFKVYRMAGVTYDRGVLFDRTIGGLDFGIGLVNGNGIEDNLDINSPGLGCPMRGGR